MVGIVMIALPEPRVVSTVLDIPGPVSVTDTGTLASALFEFRTVTSMVCCPFTGAPIVVIESVPSAAGAATVTVTDPCAYIPTGSAAKSV